MKIKEKKILELNFSKKNRIIAFLSIYVHEKKNITLSLILLTIKHSPAMLLPIILGNVINAIISHGPDSLHKIIVNSVIILILYFQNIFTHTYYIKYLSKANRSIENSLRFSLIKRLQELSISFHTHFESGRLQSKVLRDVESIEILSRQMVNVVFTGILNIIFAMIATIMHNYWVALFYLVTVPLATLLIRIFQKGMSKGNSEYRSQIEIMSARVSDMVQMITITRAHGAEETEIKQLNGQFAKVKEKGIKLDVINAIFGASTWVTYQVFQFICLLVTAYMAYKGKIAIGDVIMYQGFFGMIINSVNMIINISPDLNRGFDSIQSLGEILECTDIELNEGKQKVNNIEGYIQFNNVKFHYLPEKIVINDISFKTQPGECIAVVGESGAGKSTLISLLIGYIRPVSGTILLDGQNMANIDLRTYRQFLSVVPQNIILFSGSIKDNILYGLQEKAITHEKFISIAKMSRVDEFVEQLPDGYNTMIGEHGSRLSGGQRQRIAIARALVRDPKIIIFDEATSSLDVESERAIQNAIADIIKGRTTFIIAHRLSTIRKADRIMFLEKGSIAEIGSHAELMEMKAKYYNMNMIV
jgi:ATP-binding cassette subfamily B protein